jgi:phenylacetate-CoA ligase
MDEVFRRYLGALGKTEWMAPEHLASYQRGLVRQLVEHAHSQIPFHAKRLGCLLTADREIDLRRWNEVPVLTREDATAYSEEMRAHDLPARWKLLHRPIRVLGSIDSTMHETGYASDLCS